MPTDLLFAQRFLKAQGLYTGNLDGVNGPKTKAAIAEFAKQSDAIALNFGRFDDRSEQVIISLHLRAQECARRMLTSVAGKLGSSAIVVKALSGTRTYAEQDDLYSQGRTKPGKVVTNAQGGQSNHNFGTAFDCGIFDHSNYLEDSPLYTKAADIALAAVPELDWGGRWHSISDLPHYQLKSNLTLAETRALFEAGKDYVS